MQSNWYIGVDFETTRQVPGLGGGLRAVVALVLGLLVLLLGDPGELLLGVLLLGRCSVLLLGVPGLGRRRRVRRLVVLLLLVLGLRRRAVVALGVRRVRRRRNVLLLLLVHVHVPVVALGLVVQQRAPAGLRATATPLLGGSPARLLATSCRGKPWYIQVRARCLAGQPPTAVVGTGECGICCKGLKVLETLRA